MDRLAHHACKWAENNGQFLCGVSKDNRAIVFSIKVQARNLDAG